MRIRKKWVLIGFISIATVVSIVLSTVTLAQNDWNVRKTFDSLSNQTATGKEVGDYTANHGDLAGEKIKLDEPQLEEKSWYEYVDYVYSYTSEKDDDDNPYEGGYVYKIYLPADIASSSIMAIRDYDPDENGIVGSTVSLGFTKELDTICRMFAAANIAVIGTGGITSGAYGLALQVTATSSAGVINSVFADENVDIVKNAPYYAKSENVGIPNSEWNGVSNKGFYNASSITVKWKTSNGVSFQKQNNLSGTYSAGGKTSLKAETEVGAIFAKAKASAEIDANTSSAMTYGFNYQQSQSVGNELELTRTFSARDDDEVKNVPWKLCEFVVEMPFFIEQYDSDGNFVSNAYLTYTYLNGICRVFANGFIEHWNTGKLASYADFFEGFHTATEIINEAKSRNLFN